MGSWLTTALVALGITTVNMTYTEIRVRSLGRKLAEFESAVGATFDELERGGKKQKAA